MRSAPASLYAAYNVIPSPKRLRLALETGHNTVPAENAASDTWLLAQLGL